MQTPDAHFNNFNNNHPYVLTASFVPFSSNRIVMERFRKVYIEHCFQFWGSTVAMFIRKSKQDCFINLLTKCDENLTRITYFYTFFRSINASFIFSSSVVFIRLRDIWKQIRSNHSSSIRIRSWYTDCRWISPIFKFNLPHWLYHFSVQCNLLFFIKLKVKNIFC